MTSLTSAVRLIHVLERYWTISMVDERAIAICIPVQKRRRLHTRGSRMPSGKKSKIFPLALYLQKNRASEPLASIAEGQVSDARLVWTSILPAASAAKRE